MNDDDLKRRTKKFALDIIQICRVVAQGRDVPGSWPTNSLRSGTSVGANYRAATRAKSTADFISKMGTVEEEADESSYWMELLYRRRQSNGSQIYCL